MRIRQNAIMRSFGHAVIQCAYVIPPSIAEATECKLPAPSHSAHSTPSTPLLPTLTLSAGECKVTEGESKVSRLVGLPRNPHAPH